MSIQIITLDEELKNIENKQLQRLIILSHLHGVAISPISSREDLYNCWIKLAQVFVNNGDLKSAISECEKTLSQKHKNDIFVDMFKSQMRLLL